MIEERYKDIEDAYNHLSALSHNKSLFKPHMDEILKMKRYYYHNLKGLKKQLKKERDKG